ncbi:GNAT family N-acetyltransferase [Halobellus salinisoli]|uniref:GNAT family N-acetyltransferase n=1 Tax=Halobellus salinisoli TaxID=3108500 RepID=UPI003008F5D4
MEGSDASGPATDAVSDASAVSIDRPDPSVVDALVDLWVALATDQRAHDSHILPEENRPVVRDTIARQAVSGGVRVARSGGEVVGFVTFDIERGAYAQDETRGVVRNVYVDPEYRGADVGTALMDEAEAALREADATVISLEAMAANRRAREFYRGRGYSPHRIQFEKRIEKGETADSASE